MILAIDPGTKESGWCLLDGGSVVEAGVCPNPEMLHLLREHSADMLAVEMIASYGMAVGREVFETCVWIGRFWQAWEHRWREFPDPPPIRLVYRKDVKMHLCGTPRAKDANIRQALIDKLGAPGTKANKGPTYGVKSHAWAALGVAVTAAEAA